MCAVAPCGGLFIAGIYGVGVFFVGRMVLLAEGETRSDSMFLIFLCELCWVSTLRLHIEVIRAEVKT